MSKTFPWKHELATGNTAEEELRELYFQGYLDHEMKSLLAAIVGQELSMAALRHKREAMGLTKSKHGIPLVPRPTGRRYDKVPTIDEPCLVMADLHVPYHDSTWCNKVIHLALLWGIKNLVLAGDLMDLASLSRHVPHYGVEEESLEDNLDLGGRVFDALVEFERILYISGGHELWLLRHLKESLSMARFARMFTDLEQLEASPYHKCKIGSEWHISHPKNVSVIPARIPFFLVRKHRKNVAIGHDHVWGMVQDDSGENVGVSIGVCCDPLRLAYVALEDTTRPAVTQGALIIKNGKPWLLSPKWTDFEALRSIVWPGEQMDEERIRWIDKLWKRG
jgi:hypothetical protein